MIGKFVRDIIRLPGVVVKEVVKETVAMPARVLDGMEQGVDVLLGDDTEEDDREKARPPSPLKSGIF